MKAFARLTALLIVAGFTAPVATHATSIAYYYDVRGDWVTYDFIGWVRVEAVLESPTPELDRAKVRLKVIERLKGEPATPLVLVYQESYVPPEENILSLGREQEWRKDVGKEFLVFLKKRKDGAYEAVGGHYHPVVDGWLAGPPKEYRDYFHVPWNPHITEFIEKYRAKEPRSEVKAGEPLLAAPLRLGDRKIETPRQFVERFFKALMENRRREAEQMIHRTESYGVPDFIRSPDPAYRKDIFELEVTWEAVLGNHAIVEISEKKERNGSELWYLLAEQGQWRLVNPEPWVTEERDEVHNLRRDPDFSLLTTVWRKIRPADRGDGG